MIFLVKKSDESWVIEDQLNKYETNYSTIEQAAKILVEQYHCLDDDIDKALIELYAYNLQYVTFKNGCYLPNKSL